jgi:hypothetical protein
VPAVENLIALLDCLSGKKMLREYCFGNSDFCSSELAFVALICTRDGERKHFAISYE